MSNAKIGTVAYYEKEYARQRKSLLGGPGYQTQPYTLVGHGWVITCGVEYRENYLTHETIAVTRHRISRPAHEGCRRRPEEQHPPRKSAPRSATHRA